MKVVGSMRIVSDIDLYCEKLVNEFIINIFIECIIEGINEYMNVYVR